MKAIKTFTLSLCLMASSVYAHDDHNHDDGTTPKITKVQTPNQIGSASLTLLNTDIALSNDYGQGLFYENPKNEVEEYINLGYASLNVFHYADAYRSFRMASKKDSNSVQALVGLTFSVIAQDASPTAVAHVIEILNLVEEIKTRKTLSAQETAWYDYAKSFLGYKTRNTFHPNLKSNILNIGDGFNNLMNIDGNNIEALAFVHWSIFSGQTMNMVINAQMTVLSRYPMHAGANHYLVHIYEMQNDVNQALPYAETLTLSAVGSAHAQHMLGHLLPQSGQWERALEYFLKADKIHNDWALLAGVPLQEDWHYAHNLDLMAATYLGLDEMEKAYSTWQLSMPYDMRAIPKAVGVLIASNRLAEAQELMNNLISGNPAWRQFLASFQFELDILKNPNAPLQKSATSSTQYDNLINGLVDLKVNKTNPVQLMYQARNYFSQRLTSGGFDGWSNGFVELLRMHNLAKNLKIGQVEKVLSDLIEASRNGTL